MTQPEQTPNQAINRGFMLGLVLFFVFIISAGLIYLMAGLLGMSGLGQAFFAFFLGPMIGSVAFGFWWIRRNTQA